jgi:hypothetical protein
MTRHRHVRLQMMQTDVSHSTRETSSSLKGGLVYKTTSQLGLAECNTIIQELGFQESHWYCILMIGVFLKFRIIKNAYSNQPFTNKSMKATSPKRNTQKNAKHAVLPKGNETCFKHPKCLV